MRVLCRAEGGAYVEQTFYSVPAVDLVFDKNGNAILADPSSKSIVAVPLKALYETTGVFTFRGARQRPLPMRVAPRRDHRDRAVGRGRMDTTTSEAEKTDAEIATLPTSRWTESLVDSQTQGKEWMPS